MAETVVDLSGEVQAATTAAIEQSAENSERIAAAITNQLARQNQEITRLLQTLVEINSRLATADDVQAGMSNAVGELL